MGKVNKIVVIGGGTGSFAVLGGLKGRVRNLTALVSMADDGGSTGVLRDELGVLPPGDVRQCLVALSDAPEELRQLFNYRFNEGGLHGHSFGNLFLSAVEKMAGNFSDAVRIASDLLRIKGRVIPITLDSVRLEASLDKGRILHGQHEIDTADLQNYRLLHLRLRPAGNIAPEATEAIRTADLIVIAPGDLYTSIGPLLIVTGASEALRKTPATIAYVCNLVTKPGHTSGLTVADHAAEIERLAGDQMLDYVIYNTAKPDASLFAKYKREGELPVAIDSDQLDQAHYKAIGKKLLAPGVINPAPGDTLASSRSFIRHNSKALANVLLSLSYKAN